MQISRTIVNGQKSYN